MQVGFQFIRIVFSSVLMEWKYYLIACSEFGRKPKVIVVACFILLSCHDKERARTRHNKFASGWYWNRSGIVRN